MLNISEMRVNHVKKPLGFQVSPLSFSWIVENDGEKGEASDPVSTRIQIKKKDEIIYDSGDVDRIDSCGFCVDLRLSPRTRYDCSVAVTSGNGETAKKESFFETGKMDEEWAAKWITPDLNEDVPSLLRKKFVCENPEESSRLYICALGVYEVYLNGEKVGNEYLAPGYHSYDFHLQVQTYDVTGLLQKGKNELIIALGDGWFRGRFNFDSVTNLYGDHDYAICELYNGAERILVTDDTWESHVSPVRFSNIYDGEIYDARYEKDVSGDDGWGSVKIEVPSSCGKYKKEGEVLLQDRMSLPVVKKEERKPVGVIHTLKQETVIDFGQNMTGWVEFDASLPSNYCVRLTAAEILQDGNFYHDNYRTAKAEYTYRSDGTTRHVRPHFTFYGFRYMKVECWVAEDKWEGKMTPDNVRGKGKECNPEEWLDLMSFTACHLRSDFDETGEIVTGNKKVDQLFSNALWSQKDNFLDVPSDCPQRDERLGWTGDAQIFSETACCNMYVPAFYRKYLWDMRAEQSILGGSVPNVVPRLKYGMVSEHGSCPWADVAVVIPWNVYSYYGDKVLLAEMYPGMKAWIDCEKKKEEALGGPHLVKDGFHFADWLALDNPEPGPIGATDSLYIASAYYCRGARQVAEAAKALGYAEDEAEYTRLSEDILAAIQKKYFDEDGLCLCHTQTGSAMAIMFDLNPQKVCNGKTARQAEGDALAQRVADNNGHLNTGFVGTPLLCPALTETGHHDLAVSLLLNEEYPGWLYCVNMGATTIWERWNSVEKDGHMNADGMNSLNHYSYGSIEAWMYRYVCGIQPDKPGFHSAKIAPHPDRRLGHAECTMKTACGTYQSAWTCEEDGSIHYRITVPYGAEAIFDVPGIHENLKAGTYSFSVTEKE